MTGEDSWALREVRERRLLLDRCDAWLFQEMERFIGNRVLEVGCGHGNLTTHLLSRDAVVGIDVSAESIATFRQRFADHPRVEAFVHDVTDPSVLGLARFQFDTAIALNVLEHIAQDALAIRNTSQLLVPGGQLIIVVPALPCLYGSMDYAIGHCRRYTAKTLRLLLERARLKIHVLQYYNLVGILGWWLNGQLFRRAVPPKGQLRLFNRLVPLVQAVERHLRAPVGLSLLAVAERGPS